MIPTMAVTTALLLAPLAALSATEPPPERDVRMAWWRDARFGMFVHWGLYSALAGTWNGQPVAKEGGMEWIQSLVKADSDAYAKAALPKFQPKPGFAREWAKLAKQAGCKYLVFTTKHHEGFSLHRSGVGDFNAGKVLDRDLVQEIVEACRAEGLRVGFYHSLIDWHHDQYEYNRSKQLPHPLRSQPYPNGERDHGKYIDYLHAQVGELLTNYGPVDVIWWDYTSEDFPGEEAWRATELMKMVREKQPGTIMNNRLFRTLEAGWKSMNVEGFAPRLDPKYGDFITPEQHIPATGMPGVDWETCMTLNTTWGFSEHDHAWKSGDVLLRNLIDIASKGGNYLLNIGPKADGTIPPETVKVFQEIGTWMKTNGESIYGTTASPFDQLPFDGRCTAKPGKLYFHIFQWPTDGRLQLPPIEVKTAYLLAAPDTKLTVVGGDHGPVVSLPASAPDPVASVLVVATK
jgi:alpha-L-fucosidase